MSTTFSGPVISQGGFIGGGMGAPAGRTFFVNTNTAPSDNRNLLRPWFDVDEDVCFSTLQGAIDACENNRGDVIYVARAYMAVTTSVLFNKAGISVIAQTYGQPRRMMGEYFAIDCSASEPAAIISKSCYINGLGFNTSWTGGISSAVTYDSASGESGWVHLHQCRVMNWGGSAVYGINFEAGANCLVEDCSFEGTSGAYTAGIAFGGSPTNNPTRNQVRDCTFQDCTYAIEHKDGTPQNMMYGPGNVTVDSKFFNSKAQSSDGIIFGNFFDTAPGAATFDVDLATLETAGVSVVGNEYKVESPGPTA